MSQLAIVGNGSEGEVVIMCQPLAGLVFIGCTEIEMRNINFVSCVHAALLLDKIEIQYVEL